MKKAEITFGFATFMDYYGAAPTLQNFCKDQAHILDKCEILVVDQTDPRHKQAQMLMDLVGKLSDDLVRKRYVSMPEPKGTSTSRQKFVDLVETPYFCCVDSHILTYPGFIESQLEYHHQNPDNLDLLHGRLMLDNLKDYWSHMEPMWREEMLGIWSTMWECHECGRQFFVHYGQNAKTGGSQAMFCRSPFTGRWEEDLLPFAFTTCECGFEMPVIRYEGHERELRRQGFSGPADDPEAAPFEIPAHGMGMFGARKEAWEKAGGFPRACRGFGGEEVNIHRAFRKIGGKAMLLPGCSWWHRFGREAAPYKPAQLDKIRNNRIWYRSLGLDENEVFHHFGSRQRIKDPIAKSQWDKMTKELEKGVYTPYKVDGRNNAQRTGEKQVVTREATLDEIFTAISGVNRDLNEHMELLREYAKKCKHVTEFSSRRESFIAILAGKPDKFISYNSEGNDPLVKRVHEIFKKSKIDKKMTFTTYAKDYIKLNTKEVEETEMLFINTLHEFHNGEHLTKILDAFIPKVKRFLIVHDTESFGEKGDNDREGLNHALRKLCAENPEWKPIHFDPRQYGITVLSRKKHDHPLTPVYAWPPGFGPGTEMKKILSAMGINPTPSCPCNKRAKKMDEWGVEGCRQNFDQIVTWIEESAEQWGWKAIKEKAESGEEIQLEGEEKPKKMSKKDKLKAIKGAIMSGVAFRLNPLHPYKSLVEESIRRAEKEEKKRGLRK